MSLEVDMVGEREKKAVALSSVIAAIFLTGMKLVVGLVTNSLGILSEALHSGLDLVAAVVTLLAVRVSDRPADKEHPYGHGKIENLSALVETLLLLATCIWIVYEAINRLIKPVHVEATIWSFAVMATSIVVDVTRSRALMRSAKKYNSQALEADALHFSTDVWSSSVVIGGLAGVWVAQWLGSHSSVQAQWLLRADAVAALGVSGIVVYVSYQLGRRTINALLDTADKGLADKVEQELIRLPDVSSVQRVRVRHGGPATFVDLTIAVPRSMSFEGAHRVASEAQSRIEKLVPRADVMVHIAPVVKDRQSLVEEVWSAAAREGVGVHAIRAHDLWGKLSLDMHIEVPEDLTLQQAHERVSEFEHLLREEIPRLEDIVTHIEPVGDAEVAVPSVETTSDEVRKAVLQVSKQVRGLKDCREINIHSDGQELSLSLLCVADPALPLTEAHRMTVELEDMLHSRLPELGRVVIHLEPCQTENAADN